MGRAASLSDGHAQMAQDEPRIHGDRPSHACRVAKTKSRDDTSAGEAMVGLGHRRGGKVGQSLQAFIPEKGKLRPHKNLHADVHSLELETTRCLPWVKGQTEYGAPNTTQQGKEQSANTCHNTDTP